MDTQINANVLEQLLEDVIKEVRGHRARYQEARSWFVKKSRRVKGPHTPLRYILPLIQHWTQTRHWPSFSTFSRPKEEALCEAYRVIYVAWLLADIAASEFSNLRPWDDWAWPQSVKSTCWALAEPERYETGEDLRVSFGPPLQEKANPPAGWRELVQSALGVVAPGEKDFTSKVQRVTELEIPVKLTTVAQIIGYRSDVIAGRLRRAKCGVIRAGRSNYAEDMDLQKIYPKYRSFRANNETPHDPPRRKPTRRNAQLGTCTQSNSQK